MAYRIIYPRRLQVFAPVDHDGKLQGRLIVDWDQYGIFSKESYLDITLVPRRGRWQVQDISRHDIDVFYLESFKIALNFYLRKKMYTHLLQGISSGGFQTYHFESVFFDISKHRYRFFLMSVDRCLASISLFFAKSASVAAFKIMFKQY